MRSNGPGQSALLLLDVVERLVKDGIDYAVIGAIAASVHGIVRASFDASDSYGNRVDLLAGLRGLEPAAFSRAFVVPFKGSEMRVIGREDFIAMKLFAGGPQDIADARNALLLAPPSLDMTLLRTLTQRFGRDADTALQKLVEETNV